MEGHDAWRLVRKRRITQEELAAQQADSTRPTLDHLVLFKYLDFLSILGQNFMIFFFSFLS